MRIAVISSVKYEMNGISTVIENLYANNIFKEEDITFIFPSGSNCERIKTLKSLGYKVILLERNNKPIRYYLQLKKILKTGGFDVLHVNGNSATNTVELLAGKRAKIPVRIMHNHSAQCLHPIINALCKPILNLCCNVRFACSKEAGQFLFGKRACNVINNGFKVENYQYNINKRKQLREQFNISTQTVIGHVGVFSCLKNQEFALKVFVEYRKLNPNSLLLFIGDGELKLEIETQAKELKIEAYVIFAGNRDNVCELLNVFDYFIFPSRFEGLGIAPIEAQANGLPVLASNRIPQVVKINDNFVFLPLEDGEKVWSEFLLSLPLARDENGCRNVALAGFDIGNVIEEVHNIYGKLLEEKKCK